MNQSNFCWNENWIYPYESPFSIFEKFKFTNNIGKEEIRELFYKKQNKQLSNNSYSKYYLLNLNSLDDNKVMDILNYPLIQQSKIIIQELMRPLFVDQRKYNPYFSRNLRYCNMCFDLGYHSIFHQFLLLNICPFHNLKLVEKCPNCKIGIPFVINNNQPFCCDCGYNILNKEHNFSDYLRSNRNSVLTKIYNNELENYLHLGEKSIFIDPNYFVSTKNKEHFIDTTLNSMKTEHATYKAGIKSKIDYFTKDSYQEVYRSTNSTFKSISRHIRKRTLKKHRKCIRDLIKNKPINSVCPHALSYVFWRMVVEGLNSVSIVDNSKQKKRNATDIFVLNFMKDNEILESLYNFLSTKLTKNHQLAILLINKYLSLILLERYYLIRNHLNEQTENDLFIELNQIENIHITVLFVLQKKKENYNSFFKIV